MTIKLRTQQIVIDVPRATSEPWVHLTVQRVELDDNGKELNVVDRWGTANRRLSEIALDTVSYFEPVPGLDANTMTMFALADAIKSAATDWIIEKYGGTKNANGDVILDARN